MVTVAVTDSTQTLMLASVETFDITTNGTDAVGGYIKRLNHPPEDVARVSRMLR